MLSNTGTRSIARVTGFNPQRRGIAGRRWLARQLFPPRVSRPPGQDLVEFAIILPVLILFLVGIVDLGRVFFNLAIVNNAAREGARYSIIYGLKLPDPTLNFPAGCKNTPCTYLEIKTADIAAAVREEALELGVDLSTAGIIVQCRDPASGTVDPVRCKSPAVTTGVPMNGHDQLEVIVTYPFNLITGVIFSNPSLDLVRRAGMRVP